MSGKTILLDRSQGVATITLNRADAGNAIDVELAHELLRTAIECEEDKSVRCVLLNAAGPRFCVGGDLLSLSRAGSQLGPVLKELTGYLHLAISRLAHMKKPLVTAINGATAGAGVSLAILGDIALAAKSSHFTWAYGSVGLTPDGGVSWLLPRLIGLRRTQEFAYSGRRLSADEAASLGMITRSVDDNELAGEATQIAQSLAQSATAALGKTRDLLFSTYEKSFEAQMDAESRSITDAALEGDGREGLAAFAAKRKPEFSKSKE